MLKDIQVYTTCLYILMTMHSV